MSIVLILLRDHWLDVQEDPFFVLMIEHSEEYDRLAMEIVDDDWIKSSTKK